MKKTIQLAKKRLCKNAKKESDSENKKIILKNNLNFLKLNYIIVALRK